MNKDENLLTRLQNINLCFHFEVEQQVNGVFLNFFGFNGTAGVWRIKALEDSGGWLERTTVEDMDIAVRAHLNGWKFIFLNDVKVLCELPESYEAYKKQQHRWHSGPMQLFRLCLPAILTSKVLDCSSHLFSTLVLVPYLLSDWLIDLCCCMHIADINLEEGQLDIPFLPSKETHTSILLIHIVLHHTAIDNVHTGGRIAYLGDLLCTNFHVTFKHTPISEILPILGTLPSLREHNVSHKIQCHGLRIVSAWKRVRMGCDKEDRKII